MNLTLHVATSTETANTAAVEKTLRDAGFTFELGGTEVIEGEDTVRVTFPDFDSKARARGFLSICTATLRAVD